MASVQQNEWFKSLDASKQKIIETIIENHEALRQDLTGQLQSLTLEHQKTRKALFNQAEQDRKTQLQHSILESLRFPTMESRQETIALAHKRTFKWIFRDPVIEDKPWSNFIDWLENGNGIYWITGKPGSGKSTLMRFIVDNPKTDSRLKLWAKDGLIEVPRFFFWAAGDTLQRSQTGLLRTLLVGILERQPHLLSEVFPKEWTRIYNLLRNNVRLSFADWTLPRLQHAFERLLGHASPELRFCLFIDGLDECEGDHDEFAEFLSSLAQSEYIKLCISSRTEIVFMEAFKNGPKLRLQDMTAGDIHDFVNDRLKENKNMAQLMAKEPQATRDLINSVVRGADGVFLWVNLVIKSLSTGLRERNDFSILRRRLEVLPKDMESLYAHLLSSIEPLHLLEGLKIFLFQSLHKRFHPSLKLDHLYLALKAELEHVLNAPILRDSPEAITYYESLGIVVDRDSIAEYMENILKTRCGGLLEIQPCIHSQELSLNYIHRTAKDYIHQPKIWNKILEHTEKCDYSDPYLSLFMGSVLLLKINWVEISASDRFELIDLWYHAAYYAGHIGLQESTIQLLVIISFFAWCH